MASVPPASTPSLRVFVVEDHDDMREMLAAVLTLLGHEVHCAANMQEALAALPAADADVLISDIGLPDGDGWELMRRLRTPRRPYAIAMSGFGLCNDRERSAAVGFRHHLVKPMTIEQLEALLAEAAHERARAAFARHSGHAPPVPPCTTT